MTDALLGRAHWLQPPRGVWFGLFVVVQIGFVAAAVLLQGDERNYVLLAPAVVIGVVYLAFLPVYPWLVVPLLFGSTSLDLSGQLVKKTPLGIPLTGFHLSLGLLIVALAANTFLRRRRQFPAFELRGPLLMLLGLIALSLTWSPNQPEATISFVRMSALVLFLYMAQVMIDSKAAVVMVIVSLAVCLNLASILGLVQVLTEEFFLPASFVLAVGANTPRATGTFHNPNHLGTFLMAGVMFLTALLINLRMNRALQLGLIVSIGVGTAGLVSTFSRANWVAAAVGLTVTLWASGKFKIRYLVMTLVVIMAGIFALREVLPFADYVATRVVSIFALFSEFGSSAHVSGSARVQFVQAGFGMWLDNPLFGAGWRAFPVILDAYKPSDFPHWIPTRESHTLFATIAAELGLLGILASAWFLWKVADHGLTALRAMQDPFLRAVLIALLTVFVCFQVSLTFTNDFANNFVWFFTGMIFAVIRIEQQQTGAVAQDQSA